MSRYEVKPGSPSGVKKLHLIDYQPRTELVVEKHETILPICDVFDGHVHLGKWLTKNNDWAIQDVPALIAFMDQQRIRTMINLDGLYGENGEDLEANISRYDQAYPGRFITFAQPNFQKLRTMDNFEDFLVSQVKESADRGAKGIKIWKNLGLKVRDASNRLIALDDERLFDFFEVAGEIKIPILIHVGDPAAFFHPLDRYNERYEEMIYNPDWQFNHGFPSLEVLLKQFEHLIANHKNTTFIGAHCICSENLAWVSSMLAKYSNLYVDTGARLSEFGRQPNTALKFFTKYKDRIIFGSDQLPVNQNGKLTNDQYNLYWRFFQTEDDYFPYSPNGYSQGRWYISGINLSEEILKDIYIRNAEHVIFQKPRT